MNEQPRYDDALKLAELWVERHECGKAGFMRRIIKDDLASVLFRVACDGLYAALRTEHSSRVWEASE